MTPEQLSQLCAQQCDPPEVFFRLYHDQQGRPLFYSMQDVPGTYIEISQEDYNRSSGHVRVRDGRIVAVTWQTAQKLTPGDTGTCCDTRDVAVVTSMPGTYWSKQSYES